MEHGIFYFLFSYILLLLHLLEIVRFDFIGDALAIMTLKFYSVRPQGTNGNSEKSNSQYSGYSLCYLIVVVSVWVCLSVPET